MFRTPDYRNKLDEHLKLRKFREKKNQFELKIDIAFWKENSETTIHEVQIVF